MKNWAIGLLSGALGLSLLGGVVFASTGVLQHRHGPDGWVHHEHAAQVTPTAVPTPTVDASLPRARFGITYGVCPIRDSHIIVEWQIEQTPLNFSYDRHRPHYGMSEFEVRIRGERVRLFRWGQEFKKHYGDWKGQTGRGRMTLPDGVTQEDIACRVTRAWVLWVNDDSEWTESGEKVWR